MGVLLLLIGLAALGFGFAQHLKGKRILAAPFKKTGEIAKNPTSSDPKGLMSTQGTVVPPAQALLSPCSKTPCLYYEVDIKRNYEKTEQTQDGTKTSKGSSNVETVKDGATFGLDDGSGQVMVDASKGGDFDNLKKANEYNVKIGSFVPGELLFGELRFRTPLLPSGEYTSGFTATERIVPVGGDLFALGRLEGSKLVKPGWRSMMFSSKGREGLLASTAKKKKGGFIGGGIAAVASIPLMIFGPSSSSGPSHDCSHLINGAQAQCDDNVRFKSGNDYTWSVEKPGQYELEVTPPAGKKFPLDAQLVVKNAAGEVVKDEVGSGPGTPVLVKLDAQPGSYTVTVKDVDGTEVKGGFDYKFAIRAPAGAEKAGEAVAEGEAPAGKPGELAWKNLDKLNVKLQVPGDAQADDTTGDFQPKPPPSYSVYNESGFNADVAGTTELDPHSLDSMKNELKMDPNKVKKYTKSEKSKDGWVLEWEADSMMEPGKTLYGVNVRKTIAGKGISCSRNVEKKELAEQISAACQTMTAINDVPAAKGTNVASAKGSKKAPKAKKHGAQPRNSHHH